MNVVLFLGAGFSKPFGFPTMDEFFPFIRSHPHLSDEEKAYIDGLRRSFRQAASTIKGRETNLEDVLSLASMADFRPAGEINIHRVLQRAFGLHAVKSDPTLGQRFAGELVDAAREGRVTVITTNYDLVVESLLSSAGVTPALPLDADKVLEIPYRSTDAPQYDLWRADSRVVLCKLHGSINWFSDPAGRRLDIEPARLHAALTHPDISSAPSELPGRPLIVPPTYFKERAGDVLATIWEAASQALAKADRLTIIGYSFPESDAHMRYFLAAALQNNTPVEKIWLIAPDAQGTIDHLKRGVAFGDGLLARFQPYSAPWEKLTNWFGEPAPYQPAPTASLVRGRGRAGGMFNGLG